MLTMEDVIAITKPHNDKIVAEARLAEAERRVASLQAEREWRPIETAPRDSLVIIAVEPTEQNRAFFGKPEWLQTHPAYINEDGTICNVDSGKPDRTYESGAWRATHWQPLPIHPRSSAEQTK